MKKNFLLHASDIVQEKYERYCESEKNKKSEILTWDDRAKGTPRILRDKSF